MLALTIEERKVIIFLFFLLLIGTGTNFILKKMDSPKAVAFFNQDFQKIDLNQADKEELKSVSGIGEVLAGRILEYRKVNGKFKNREELRSIKGISEKKYESFKEKFFVR